MIKMYLSCNLKFDYPFLKNLYYYTSIKSQDNGEVRMLIMCDVFKLIMHVSQYPILLFE